MAHLAIVLGNVSSTAAQIPILEHDSINVSEDVTTNVPTSNEQLFEIVTENSPIQFPSDNTITFSDVVREALECEDLSHPHNFTGDVLFLDDYLELEVSNANTISIDDNVQFIHEEDHITKPIISSTALLNDGFLETVNKTSDPVTEPISTSTSASASHINCDKGKYLDREHNFQFILIVLVLRKCNPESKKCH